MAQVNNAQCLDGKTIQIYGRSSFEFCDVYSQDKVIIHIKRYSSSAVLSHLFNQGYVSGNFLLDEDFREKINEILDEDCKIKNTSKQPNVPGNDQYKIIFGIVSKSSSDFDLPFFSKMTLMHVIKTLKKFGYQVSLVKVKNTKK